MSGQLPRVHNRAGWRMGQRYYIGKNVWSTEIHAGSAAKRAAETLRNAGHLVHDAGRLDTKAPAASGRVRSYCVDASILEHGGDD